MSLENEDKTPSPFVIKKEDKKEKFKKIIRRFIYPPYLKMRQKLIEKKFSFVKEIGLDKLFLGQRGNDYAAQRRRINKFNNIKNSTILIIGVGTGKDLESWLKYNPKKIIAVDYFNYERAWNLRLEQYKNKYTTEIEFLQADIVDLNKIKNESIDIIGSDAVFEHVNKFLEVICELKRILKKEGILYASFGPLWYGLSGDHISGKDKLVNAYNHIRLEKKEYEKYLDTFGEYTHSENDGRTWIKNNLFSYLKPKEYLDILDSHGLKKLYTSAIIDDKALLYKKRYPKIYHELVERFEEKNLLVSGMTIIYAK